MTKLSLEEFPEVVVSKSALTKTISSYVQQKRLRKLASRLIDSPEAIIKRNLWIIIGGFFPEGLIADHTAIENQPSAEGLVFWFRPKRMKLNYLGSLYAHVKDPFLGPVAKIWKK